MVSQANKFKLDLNRSLEEIRLRCKEASKSEEFMAMMSEANADIMKGKITGQTDFHSLAKVGMMKHFALVDIKRGLVNTKHEISKGNNEEAIKHMKKILSGIQTSISMIEEAKKCRTKH